MAEPLVTVMLMASLMGQPLKEPDMEMCDEFMGNMAMELTDKGWKLERAEWNDKTRHFEIVYKGKKEIEFACDGVKLTKTERDRLPKNAVCTMDGDCG